MPTGQIYEVLVAARSIQFGKGCEASMLFWEIPEIIRVSWSRSKVQRLFVRQIGDTKSNYLDTRADW